MEPRIIYHPKEKIEFRLNDVNQVNGQQIFREVAEDFQNNYFLSVNGNLFRFIKIEFYYWSPSHMDPFVYGNENQKKMGLWCFHYSGIDLTIGTDEEHFGGILLRRLQDFKTKDYLDGVWKIHDKVVSFFGNAINANVNLSIIRKEYEKQQPSYGLKRIGLDRSKPKQKGETELFLEKKYRFIVDTDEPNHNYLGKDDVRKARFL